MDRNMNSLIYGLGAIVVIIIVLIIGWVIMMVQNQMPPQNTGMSSNGVVTTTPLLTLTQPVGFPTTLDYYYVARPDLYDWRLGSTWRNHRMMTI